MGNRQKKLGTEWEQNLSRLALNLNYPHSKGNRFNELLAEACGSRNVERFYKPCNLTALHTRKSFNRHS
jgi:hypothetical protein